MKRKLLCILCVATLILLSACNKSKTVIEFKMSESVSDVKEKSLELDGDTKLHMKGNVKLESGEVIVSIVSGSTDEILLEKEFASTNAGDFSLDLDKLENEKDVILRINTSNVTKFSIKIESEQPFKTKDMVAKPEK